MRTSMPPADDVIAMEAVMAERDKLRADVSRLTGLLCERSDQRDKLSADNERLINLCKSIHYQYCASVCPTGDHHEAACQDISASIK